ncbi:MAG TPA: flagellar biosynthesis protein FlhF, partial [Rhizobacter sp.]|nr:flagellar biosynthesis protein FlhF [Rhizobacter sp.]
MNVKRFTARTSRDALTLVRQAFGEDAVVLSTKPCPEGVEVLAMAPESVQQIERLSASSMASNTAAGRAATQGASAPASFQQRAASAKPAAAQPAIAAPARSTTTEEDVSEDVARLSMSTLSFQDYVRERMLKRRQAAIRAHERQQEPTFVETESNLSSALEQRLAARQANPAAPKAPALSVVTPPAAAVPAPAPAARAPLLREPPVLREEVRMAAVPSLADTASAVNQAVARRDQQDMMNELRSMKGLIEDRFGALAFMEKLQRQPVQAQLIQKLLDCGFSPALTRKLVESMPTDIGDENAWAANVLERNLLTGEAEASLEDQGGVFALIGSTGVGKTTSAAKIAAAFATKHGAGNLGLITLDAYRVGAHEQLRAYGRILGVPVHTAHDRASLEDLLELLASKKMVLIDTAGMAQRDSRTR